MKSNLSYSPETLNAGQNWQFFCPAWPWNLMADLENNRAPLLYYIKLCAAFQSHWYIKTAVTVRKRSIQVKIGDFLSRVTLKIDRWPWKTIGHLSYAEPILTQIYVTIWHHKATMIYIHVYAYLHSRKWNWICWLQNVHQFVGLTHWPLGDMAVISNVQFLNSSYRIVAWEFEVKLLSGECHRALLMRRQQWFR